PTTCSALSANRNNRCLSFSVRHIQPRSATNMREGYSEREAASGSLLQVPARQALLIARVEPSIRERDLGPARQSVEHMGPRLFAVFLRRRLDRHQVAVLRK